MKKTLLLAFSLCMASAGFASEPLTQEQLDLFRPLINTNANTGEYTSCSTISLEYSDASNPTTMVIKNFDDGSDLRTNIDWETGTISVAPYAFSGGYDEDTYQSYYIMLVNEEAANCSSPMDAAFSSSKVSGTISEDKITLDKWYLVKIDQYFSSITRLTDTPTNTTIHIPNATMTLNTYEWDDEWENLVAQETPVTMGIYTEANTSSFTVYGWYDQPSRMVFNAETIDGKLVYTLPEDYVIYKNSKYEYAISPLTGSTWEEVEEIGKAAFSSKPVENKTTVEFGSWIIKSYRNGNSNDLCMGSAAKSNSTTTYPSNSPVSMQPKSPANPSKKPTTTFKA